MSAAAEAEEILHRPNFTLVYRKVQDALAAERARRERFYAEMDESKVEFINGQVVMHSPVRSKHNVAVSTLCTLLTMHNARHKLGYVGVEKILICLTRNDFEPDVCFFSQEKAAAFHPDQLKFPAPDFIVEVLSPSTEDNDRGIKFVDYAAHGVSEYWIVDPDAQAIEQYWLVGDEYELAGKNAGNEVVTSRAVAGFRIPASALFDQQAADAFIAQELKP